MSLEVSPFAAQDLVSHGWQSLLKTTVTGQDDDVRADANCSQSSRDSRVMPCTHNVAVMLCQDSEQSKHHACSVVHALLFHTAQMGLMSSKCHSLFVMWRTLQGSSHGHIQFEFQTYTVVGSAQLVYKASCRQVCICMCQLLCNSCAFSILHKCIASS